MAKNKKLKKFTFLLYKKNTGGFNSGTMKATNLPNYSSKEAAKRSIFRSNGMTLLYTNGTRFFTANGKVQNRAAKAAGLTPLSILG